MKIQLLVGFSVLFMQGLMYVGGKWMVKLNLLGKFGTFPMKGTVWFQRTLWKARVVQGLHSF